MVSNRKCKKLMKRGNRIRRVAEKVYNGDRLLCFTNHTSFQLVCCWYEYDNMKLQAEFKRSVEVLRRISIPAGIYLIDSEIKINYDNIHFGSADVR